MYDENDDDDDEEEYEEEYGGVDETYWMNKAYLLQQKF